MLIGTDLHCMFLLFSVDLSSFVLITVSVAAAARRSGAHLPGELPCRVCLFVRQDFDLIAVRRVVEFRTSCQHHDAMHTCIKIEHTGECNHTRHTNTNAHAPTQATRTRRYKIYGGSRPPAGFNSPPESSLCMS